LQANSEIRSASPKVLVFPKHMAKPASPSSQPDLHGQIEAGLPPGYSPPRHGSWAQWAAVIMSAVAVVASIWFGLSNRSLTERYHDEASLAKASDDHTNQLIDAKLDPKLGKINDQLGQLSRDVSRIEGKLNISIDEQQNLKSRVDQQIALAKMTDPKRVDRAVAVIRTEIEKARSTKQPIPIAEYRAALRTFPDTTIGYWKTVADIINYQSYLDQKLGLAPDPKSVARWCPGLTAGSGGYNTFNGPIQNCIVDLDTTHNLLENVTIRNSVIRYHGGSVGIKSAVLMNCYFEVDLIKPPNPSQTELLRAILDSPEQKTVVLQHIKAAPG
jgi:hypothetical protein